MEHLKINQIGAIKSVDIDLNKINVIIGPQSSGKSTICKIACYCSWVEKRICLSQSFEYFLVEGKFFDELVTFHKLKGYFSKESYIEYETDVIKFSYKHSENKPRFIWKKRYDYKQAKISYIPSERNLVSSINNWFQVKFEDNNIRNFMIDWADARKIYTKEHPLTILKLNNIKYYFDEDSGRDLVEIDEQGTTLDLTNTSSGLQSIIPLEVVIEYLTNYIYDIDNDSSVNDDSTKKLLNQKIYKDLFAINKIDFPAEGGDKQLHLFIDNREIRIFESKDTIKKYQHILEQVLHIQLTKLYIEEPEQNIFPETQKDIIYYFLQIMSSKRKHKLFFTTHSPYVLYALNNCMMGGLLGNKIPEVMLSRISCKDSFIDPKMVNIWQLNNGTLKIIQQDDGLISSNYFDDKMKDIMDDFYKMLNFYGNDKSKN